MRLSNRNRMPLYRFGLTIINVMLIIGAILFLYDFIVERGFPYDRLSLLLVPIAILYIYFRMGRPEFQYDSNGEAIVIKNKGILRFLKEKNDEFPKYKLINYQIRKFLIFKRLLLIITSKRKGQIVLSYDISFLKSKEIKDLKISLHRTIQQYKEAQAN